MTSARSFDIVVVGSGPAGITAAITACHHKQRVAVVEKAERIGGTGLGSAYGIWVPQNHHLKALGIPDDRESCLKLMCKYSFPKQFDEKAEHYGIPASDYEGMESYYDFSAEMLELFEKDTGIHSRPMLNHSRDRDVYEGTKKELEARGIYKTEEMQRWMTDYHAQDPLNRVPAGRYLTFGPGIWSAIVYYLRILLALGWKAILRSCLQLLNPAVLFPLCFNLFGKHREGVFRYAGSGVRVSNFAAGFFARHGVHVALKTRMKGVDLGEDGRVCAVEVEADGGKAERWETKAVVLATGGFNYDPALLAKWAPEIPIFASNGAPTCTGDALTALRNAKPEQTPKLAHMDKFWHTDTIFEVVARNYPYDPYASNNVWYMNGDSFIVVDQHGKRCVDESLPYSLRAKYYRRPDKLLTFLVFDKRCYRRSGGVFRYLGAGVPNDLWFGLLESSWLIHGRDSKELGQRISERLERYRDVADVKLDGGFASALDATIERYNGFAQKGVDDDFGRGSNLGTAAWLLGRVRDNHFPNKHMHPMDASQGLFAIVMAPTCFSTKGGLVVDRFARVVGQNGAPIDGLYAAGNCTASPSNEGYVLSTIGPAMTQGYLAASHAAGALRNADGH